MLVASINQFDKHTLEQACEQADVIELRLDYAPSLELKPVLNRITKPVIFTLRKASQGGKYEGDESSRLKEIESLMTFEPDYFDIEYDVDIAFVEQLKQKHPKVKLICSYHDFAPRNADIELNSILENMLHPTFHSYKIAIQANSSLKSLCMMNFIKQCRHKVTGICIGEFGEITRITSPTIGNHFHYACLTNDSRSAPGQLSINELKNTYRIHKQDQQTKIYALIGNPVENSIGHIFHNQAFNDSNKNAVYVKIALEKTELKEFFQLTNKLPFKGFSVTMPHKENVIPFVETDELSVNTITVTKEGLIGSNTDGKGAIDAVEAHTSIKNKTVLIIGAGGAAKAIAKEALTRNAKVIITNRTYEKASKLAKELNCQAHPQTAIKDYDILINTTPCKTELPLPQKFIHPNKIVMDIVYNPKNTALLTLASTKNCQCIYGIEMFENQARRQLQTWTYD